MCNFRLLSHLLPLLFSCIAAEQADQAGDCLPASAGHPNAVHGKSLLQSASHTSPVRVTAAEGPSESGRKSSKIWEQISVHLDFRAKAGLTVLLVLLAVLGLYKWVTREAKIYSKHHTKDEAENHTDTVHRQVSKGASDTSHGDIVEEESDTGEWTLDELVGSGGLGNRATTMLHDLEQENVIEDNDNAINDYVQKEFGSWQLLKKILIALGEFWAALGFMYWSLLTNEEAMMDCNDKAYAWSVRHACYYTTACLRGFPILAANVVLVIMLRIMVQNRLYYSFLKREYLVHFACAPVMYTGWPVACALSMGVGVLHFALKAIFEKAKNDDGFLWIIVKETFTVMRKFGLPGLIFLSFLARYSDIEKTLVPLNRISERDTAKGTQGTFLGRVTKMNERILAMDARKRDVVGDCQKQAGKAPTLDDVITNLVNNYKNAEQIWGKRRHREWGLFRSMWPTSVLVDIRLDRQDPDTRAWLLSFTLLGCGCMITSTASLYLLFFRILFTGSLEAVHQLSTEVMLGDAVLVFHGMLIIVFIYRSIKNMFYFAFEKKESEIEELDQQDH